jgi:hypothetical protein
MSQSHYHVRQKYVHFGNRSNRRAAAGTLHQSRFGRRRWGYSPSRGYLGGSRRQESRGHQRRRCSPVESRGSSLNVRRREGEGGSRTGMFWVQHWMSPVSHWLLEPPGTAIALAAMARTRVNARTNMTMECVEWKLRGRENDGDALRSEG